MDCAGHGTHVAGIIAGNLTLGSSSRYPGFGFAGVAHAVTLGAYKVFGCTGGTTSELVVAALDQAARDGMQVRPAAARPAHLCPAQPSWAKPRS
jgi:minor extracellular serine protease Vpr